MIEDGKYPNVWITPTMPGDVLVYPSLFSQMPQGFLAHGHGREVEDVVIFGIFRFLTYYLIRCR